MNYKQKQQLLEDAFARGLLLEYDIREVTTKRQALNGTREFEFPASCFSKQLIKRNSEHSLPKTRLRLAIFKSGMIRKQNGAYCAYPINKRYKQNQRSTWLKDGKLTTYKTHIMAYQLVHDSIARLNVMLNFYLKNYKNN
jgi:hypothetical protein